MNKYVVPLIALVVLVAGCGTPGNAPHVEEMAVAREAIERLEDDPANCQAEYEALWKRWEGQPPGWEHGVFHLHELGSPRGCERHHALLLCRVADIDPEYERFLKLTVRNIDGEEQFLRVWLGEQRNEGETWVAAWNRLGDVLHPVPDERDTFEVADS